MVKQIDYAPMCSGYNVNANIRDGGVVGLMNASRIHAVVTHDICDREREREGERDTDTDVCL